jgi:signal transduction histidine kinase
VKLTAQLGSTNRDPGRWLVLLCLLIGVLAPTICVLWFMNDALTTQKELTRRRIEQAYQSDLSAQRKLFSERFAGVWKDRVTVLDRQAADLFPAAAFDLAIRSGAADSVIVLTRDGAPAYPAPLAPPSADPFEQRADWADARRLESSPATLAEAAAAYGRIAAAEPDAGIAALAAQAQIRCLMRAGEKSAAARIIDQQFRNGRLARATDPQGRLIAADALLLARTLAPKSDRTLHTMVADYTISMPSAQRLFLMNELHESFPTLQAETLAAQFLETESIRSDDLVLRATAIPGVWHIAGARFVLLCRTPTIVAAARKLTEGSPVQAVLQPGAAVGQPPDWQITVPRSDSTSGVPTRAFPYLWVGFLAIAVVAITSLIAGQALRRQWRLARMKTDLVAAVSHELKTPLASVRLLVDSLLEDEKPDAQRTHDYLELIARENLRLSGVIENFLTFSRLERNRQKFEFSVTQPDAVVQSALEAARERLHAPDCRLEVEVSPGLLPVRADESALVTVLLNLLDNAWKYSPGEKRIAVRAYRENSRVVFAVVDNGIGIAPREQKKIFRRFYQVDRRLARDAGGFGLGLSIVEFIVRAHGGSIAVKSQPGQGSTFSVAIPEAA